MKSNTLRANLLLLLAAFVWGVAFVAQKSGLGALSPFAFNGYRFLLGGVVLLPVAVFRRRREGAPERGLWVGGLICGGCLFVASSAQQIGLQWTTAGKAGFLTALYVVIVPLLAALAGRRVRGILWLCIALAVAGLHLLCLEGPFSLTAVNRGDAWELACALAFAVHILAIDRFAPHVDGIRLSCMQFFVCGLLSLPFAGLPSSAALAAAWIPLCYTGILSCGLAYTLQAVAQKDTSPTVASLIMCLESLFALLAGAVILREPVSPREAIGAALLLAALVLAQLPPRARPGTGPQAS